MTELVSGKPIVRLPKKRSSILLTTTTTDRTTMKSSPVVIHRDALVSDRLYTEGIPSTVSENDILDLVQSCDPEEVKVNRLDGTGYIQFSSIDKADRAYTLFNDATLKNQAHFQLKILPPNHHSHSNSDSSTETDEDHEPEASSGIYQIRNLPLGTTNHILYDYFRPFGPMNLCKTIMDHQGKGFKGTALIRYFHVKDADMAVKAMNNRNIQGNAINVFPFVPKKSRPHSSEVLMFLNQQQQFSTASTSPTKTLMDANHNNNNNNNNHEDNSHSNGTGGSVDYTNLYIKNLDLDVKSSDLFKHFRQYGRIISARVMRNPDTEKSKGFGFVSFGRAEEARWALEEMNNAYILSKPIIVAYHEPKKPRSEKSGRSHDMIRRFSTPGIPPHPPPPYMPVAPPISEYIDYSKQQQQQPSAPQTRRPTMTNHNSSPAAIAVVSEKFTNSQSTIKKRQTPLPHVPTTVTVPTTTAPMTTTTHHNKPLFTPSPPLHQQPPQHYHHANQVNHHHQRPAPPPAPPSQQQQQTKPSALIRRRSSNESVTSAMTETTPDLQKQRMTDAVIRMGVKKNVGDIVDMLLTLKRKERSLCLFNQSILREQIKLAKSALETCRDDEDKELNGGMESPPTPVAQQPVYSMPLHHQHYQQQQQPLQRVSRAIPIVAPPQPTLPQESNGDKFVKLAPNSIDQFLTSIEELPLMQQKEKLGDQLFPHVKATGVKHAPKVTVRLLDTVPLEVLARTMHDKAALKAKVDVAVASLQQSQ